jgi:hypothetical protein
VIGGWWTETLIGAAVVTLARRLWSADAQRRAYALRACEVVEPDSVAPTGEPRSTQLRTWATRNAVETVEADICGRQRVRVVYLTDGADWSQRRRAVRLGRLTEAVLSAQHLPYSTGWDVLQRAWRDACALWGSGVVRVRDSETGPQLERCMPHQVMVDARDAYYGSPRTWVHRYAVSGAELAETYPDAKTDIATAGPPSQECDWLLPAIDRVMGAEDERVEVIEAWYVPPIGERRHVVVLAASNTVLLDEEWPSPRAPFAVIVWSRGPVGLWGSSFTDLTADTEWQLDDTLDRLVESTRIRAGRRVFYGQDSLDDANREKLASNDPETHIEYIGPVPPQVSDSPSLDSGLLTVMQTLMGGVFSWHGVSQMLATAQRAQGVTSAEGQRAVRDLGTQRHAVHTRDWESFHVDVSRLIVDSVRRTADDERDPEVVWRGRTSRRRLRWSDAQLDEQAYDVTATAASMLSRELSGRISEVGELFQAGLITPDVYRRLIDMPDLEAESDRENAEYEYCEQVLEAYLDADDADTAPELYVPPDGYYTRVDARLVQALQCLFSAMRDSAPEYVLDLVRRYVDDLQSLSQRLAAAAAPPPAPPATMGAPV